jgi:hypothetical protein
MIASLLLAVATVGPPAPVDAGSYQTVHMSWDARTKACIARVDGIPVGDPSTDEGAAALLAALSNKQRAVQLQDPSGVPFSCQLNGTPLLRKSGHAIKVGFISEPAPTSAPRE